MPAMTADELDKSQKVFEFSPEAIILLDSKGTIINANQRLQEWLGYSPKEVIGKKISELPFLSKKNKIFAFAQFSKRMTGQDIPPYELDFIAKDKSILIGLVQATPIKNKSGKNIMDMVMISDITARKETENQFKINSEKLERLNKLMIGREYKLSQLKAKLNGEEKDNKMEKFIPFLKNVDPASAENASFFNLGREILLNLRESSFFQATIAILFGSYVSLIVLLFLSAPLVLAIFLTCLLSLLIVVITWAVIALQAKSCLTKSVLDHAMVSLLEDINEEKTYEEVRGRSVLENIGEGIVITNEKGLVKYVNPAFEEFYGCITDDIEGKDFAEIVKMYDLKGKEIPVYERSDSAAITAKNQQMKILIECLKGKRTAFSLNAAPIRVDNQFMGVVRIMHNISEDFKLQQQKDDFFSIASHELRTPLTVIAGNIDMILQGYGKSKLSKDDQSLLVDAETATDRLIRMVNEFLNVSRLDQGRIKMSVAKLDMCRITEEVIKELSPLAKEKNLKLINVCTGGHDKVKGDENLVKEVMINLIGNSIKFTKQGEIKVSHEAENEWLVTTITDTGIGIAEDKQGKLFARFQQAMNRTMSREAGGTGLGLYISREFVRLMGGDLKLMSSTLGKGSSFAFSLPFSREKK